MYDYDISVLIPAYNAENSLRRCIDSLLEQNQDLIEIIISNDGSTDNTQLIIDEYVDAYSCISTVYGENKGLSCARNRGINIATGAYITFVDSDDFVETGIYERVIEVLQTHFPDMVEYQYFVALNDVSYKAPANSLPKDVLLNEHWLKESIIPVALNISAQKQFFIENFVWNKIYKGDIIRTHHVLFDETRRKWEDRLFSLTFLQNAKTYYSMSNYGYYYVCGTGQSLSSKFEPDILKIIMDSYCKYLDMYGSKYDFDNSFTTNYFCNLLIDVSVEQFDLAVDSLMLRDMLSIFTDDEHVKRLYSKCVLPDKNKQKLCCAIQTGSIDLIYDGFNRYSGAIKRNKENRQIILRIRNVLSRVKQVILHGK